MLFCSEAYLVFFAAIFLVYWAIPWQRARVWLLLAASCYFYACWNRWLACLICVSTFLDYALALGMDGSTSPRLRKTLLAISIVANLGLLCYFKYLNFFLESLTDLLHAAGSEASMPLLSVILPVGISFYTFEAINYTVDVYRRKLPAERNLANFMLFITFFPHLVAGPIVRARDFLRQTHRPKHWNWNRMHLGVQYFLMGLFKKLVIADRMACFVDPVFADPAHYSARAAWLAVFAYALQIYGDFSGYTDMAIGSAHLLGFKLAPNFNMPYLARNIADFWRRWHISLSTWIRDYLFIPLGGSRGTNWQVCRTMLITMTLAGLWHGASWGFVAFGVLHGLLLIGHRQFRDFAQARQRLEQWLHSTLGSICSVALTFCCVSFVWILFRAPTFEVAGQVVRAMFIPNANPAPSPVHMVGLPLTYALLGMCHWVGLQGWFKRIWLSRVGTPLPAPATGFAYAALLSLTLTFAPASGKAFIYFQF
jgi:alginate O-acetyltransferase complex protein AlgI